MKDQQKKFNILNEELVDHIASLDPDEQALWLILDEHPEFKTAWKVDSLDPKFFFEFEEILGPYSLLFPRQLDEFLCHAHDLGYQIAFAEDPQPLIDNYLGLDDPPDVTLNSELEDTINGFLPWQVQAYNKLIKPDLRGGLVLHSTGTGKTAFVAAGLKHHDYDVALVVVKSNNKSDMQKKIKQLGNIDSTIIAGTPTKCLEIFEKAVDKLIAGEQQVFVTNYEKLRDYEEFFKLMVEDRRVLIFWDEMPTRLRSRETQVYDAVGRILYKSWRKALWHRKRPSELRQYELTATPIENNPEDQFSCIRLIDPDVFGRIEEFHNEYVTSYNFFSKKPERWHKLDKMAYKLEFMTHKADKTDPEIAKYFPKFLSDSKYIDWLPKHRKLYDKLTSKAVDLFENKDTSILSLIMVLQMMCDAPSMILQSASNRDRFITAIEEELSFAGTTGSQLALELVSKIDPKVLSNEDHTKLLTLRELLTETHPNEKMLVFSTFSDYIFPVFEEQFKEWGISYVIFKGTDKQRLAAKDRFRNDDSIQVFLSSDAGSDSIDLPEASVVTHYNRPWKWSTEVQRENRAHRVTSTHNVVRAYTLMMDNSIEDRKKEIIDQKFGYHDGIFNRINSNELGARFGADDLYYILSGNVV